ncbi:Leucine carboxyl methyltransferase 1 [Pseudocercospora fuligena]|uniref:Leucine carboxyl methyltransferase 1 n=1 Tax=Pseudocercospora fuligena TaxID=685502 RepID=A0A8H6R8S5_9PEZI|nr:Leucine carboxyl methyltransferase 1 [Pseudocercospora fuligena]
MASIPNLNTLRSGRRGPRLRGRRGTPGQTDADNEPSFGEEDVEKARDKIIQQTDGDASSSRMSAIAMGYLEDQYAKTFFHQGGEVPKRYPIINRGTYVRTKAIDKLVTRFLETDPEQRKQIVSLGAGSDTRFFRLCANKYKVVYHELDFEENVDPKRAAIRASDELTRQTLSKEDGSAYHLHAIDLRVLTFKSPPILPGLEEDLPTLILSECCLCYLPPDTAISVLNYFTMHARDGRGMILYEPIRPFDAFGKTMISNLSSRGIELRTLKRYYSLDAQRQRLRLAGFGDGQGARDVYQLFEHDDWVSKDERERIEKLEWLDEVEEWKLLARHYCVAWGWRGQPFTKAWAAIDGSGTADERMDEDMG